MKAPEKGISIRFWGTRGSIPSPGPDTAIYGGNTLSVTARTREALVAFDAGSGIRLFGNELLRTMGPTGHEIVLCVTHTHWDHIQGLPFFSPAFIKGNRLTIAGPEIFNPGFEKVIAGQMQHSYFPIRLASLEASICFRELGVGTYRDIVPGAVLKTSLLNHPVINLGYRLEADGKSVVYLTDHECWSERYRTFVRRSPDKRARRIEEIVQNDLEAMLRELVAGADLLIMDATYSTEEYGTRLGWGHSTFDDVYDLGARAGVRAIAFFHHEPNHKDETIGRIEEAFQARAAREGKVERVFWAREGMTVEV